MGQITTKSAIIECQNHAQEEIMKLTKYMPLRQRSTALRSSNILAKLSASERRTALNIIRQRDKNGGLEYPWLISFLTALGNLKAEESKFEAK